MHKIFKAYLKLKDNHLARVLLKNIQYVDVNLSDYIFIFNQVISKFTEKLYILISHELAMRGIPSCFLYYRKILASHYPQLIIDGYEISNSCISDKKKGIRSLKGLPLFFDWSVDIEHERIEAEGINFYNYIRNTIRKRQKRYNVDFDKEIMEELIQTCDLLLKYIILLQDYSKKNNKKIRIVGYEAVYVPNGILRMLCEKLPPNGDVEFIELRRGYINYFGRQHHRASYISISNLTKTKLESGLEVTREEMERFNENSIGLDELNRPVTSALQRRTEDSKSSLQNEIILKMEDYKSRGKSAFVLFAHVFYDTPVNDESDAFRDMCDWITETVNDFMSRDALLVLKPHPGEYIKDQPKRTPTETLSSLLANTKTTENIILLPRDLFTVKDLSPFMSCGLIWRTSVAMELTFLGMPTIIAGNPPYRALNLNYAKNKEHYFEMIEKSNEIKVDDKLKIETAKYLYLLEKKHIPVSCIAYDQKLRKFFWEGKALRKYLKEGDERVTSIVENMVS
jgi:hypothetical protein